MTEQNGADNDQRSRNLKELNTLPSRQGPPRKAIGDEDHSRYTSYPAVLPQKNFRNLKATLDARISVDHLLAGNSADSNVKKDMRAGGDLREYSLHSNPGAAATFETFMNYKNNVLNLPPVGGYHNSVFSEDRTQAKTARSSATPYAPGPGNQGLAMHTSSTGYKAGASVAAGDGEGGSPPSLLFTDQSKYGHSTHDSAAHTPSYQPAHRRD